MTTPPPHGSGQAAAAAARDAVTLAPRPWLPLWILALAGLAQVLLPPWNGLPWISGITGLFGLFLLLQTTLLRLRFSPDALQVLRLEQEIRRFPYADWTGWRLFWAPVPVLFYFREIRSPHLLPMLFDGRELRRQLELRVPLSSSDASP